MKTLPLNLIHRLLICAFLVVTHVGDAAAQDSTAVDNRVSITYGGIENDHLVFYVQVSNAQQERLSCRLLDTDKNTLFEEWFSSAKFEKKFLVSRENSPRIQFRFSGKKFNYEKDFTIQTRIVEETVVM